MIPRVVIAEVWENVSPWALSRRRLVERVQRDARIIEQLGDELTRMASCHDRLHRERDAAVSECERLRTRLAEASS